MSHDPSNRIVITGYGIRAAVASVEAAFALYARGESLVAEQSISGSGDVSCIGAKTPTDPPFEYLTQRKWLKYMSPQTELAVWAAGHALCSAGHLREPGRQGDLSEMALFLATGPIAFTLDDVLPALVHARTASGEVDFAELGVTGLRACSPMMPFHTLLNMPIGLVSMIFGIKGHNTIVYPDAEQSHHVFASAIRGISAGRFGSALVGGTAQLMSLMPYLTYRRLGCLAPDAAAALPLTPGHRGWALTNAAAMIVLESEAVARARGAEILGSLSIEPNSLDTNDMSDSIRSARSDLVLLSGSRDDAEDSCAKRIAGTVPCLSLDGIVGYAGAASVAFTLAAACGLLARPELYQGGTQAKRRRITALAAFGTEQRYRWGAAHVEATS